MFHLLGHVPTEGEQVQTDALVLRAERVARRRIGRVLITPVGAAGRSDADADTPSSAHRDQELSS